MLAYRTFHGNSYQNDHINLDYAHGDNYCSISPYQGLPEIKFNFNNKAVISPHPFWYKNFLFKEEEARSYDANDDLACPANFEFELKAGEDLYISISVEDSVTEAKQAWQEESKRRERFSNQLKQTNKIKSLFNGSQDFIATLNHAAQKFIIKPSWNSTDDADEYSIIAGYHWFGEWGRDTMISLPGLLLDTNQDDIYKKILRRFLNYQQDGLIPNIIGSPPAYNSVDASLWLFWAVQQLETNTGSNKWIKQEFWQDLKNIFTAYSTSNTDKLRYQENGLIESGSKQDSLSWMDACLDGSSVIPRSGAIVEINALWYNAVCYTEQLAKSFNDPIVDKAAEIKTKIEESFTKTFYIPEKKYLGDFFNEAKLNQQLRPNQLLACSLPFSPIDIKIAQEIVEACTQKLLTPFGMRTLAPDDVNYQGHYQGDTHSRDRAYHNGTVWPWLLGPYGEALLRTSSNKTQAKKTIKEIISNFEQHLSESGITSISEIFDGDLPYQARGCIAQAWSVAEIRRLALLVS
ncbi:MAG: glycogen debranching enzyme N-terminal domain-containing protein [Cyanobacteria bacterium]|nr:glycogen debranching enzyme N-terminal domain-containing protein [Cyanobacteriota bacterium]